MTDSVWRLVVAGAAAVVLLALLFGSLSIDEQVEAATEREAAEIARIERQIDVGGATLHFAQWIGNQTTIVLEAGGGGDTTSWGSLPGDLAKATGATVVAYDRAGFGESDLPESDYDLHEELRWLMSGLATLGCDRELILVGHSYGGWFVRLIASEHPDRVRGLVLVDPFSHEFVKLLGVEYLDNHPIGGVQVHRYRDSTPPDEWAAEMLPLIRFVGAGLGPRVDVMEQTMFSRDLPLQLITCGNLSWFPEPTEGEAWRASHEQIMELTDVGKLIVADGANHMIPQIAPDLVLEAVKSVYAEAVEI